MYHNRGDSTYAGESTTYGDFSGLDDLWTERPEVVSGMEKIYEKWVRDFGVDGFRIDTVKHVDMEFWTQWATALDAYAAERGRKNFFMFGEVYSADTSITSRTSPRAWPRRHPRLPLPGRGTLVRLPGRQRQEARLGLR